MQVRPNMRTACTMTNKVTYRNAEVAVDLPSRAYYDNKLKAYNARLDEYQRIHAEKVEYCTKYHYCRPEMVDVGVDTASIFVESSQREESPVAPAIYDEQVENVESKVKNVEIKDDVPPPEIIEMKDTDSNTIVDSINSVIVEELDEDELNEITPETKTVMLNSNVGLVEARLERAIINIPDPDFIDELFGEILMIDDGYSDSEHDNLLTDWEKNRRRKASDNVDEFNDDASERVMVKGTKYVIPMVTPWETKVEKSKREAKEQQAFRLICQRIEPVVLRVLKGLDGFAENPRNILNLCETLFGAENPNNRRNAVADFAQLMMNKTETVMQFTAKFNKLYIESKQQGTTEEKSRLWMSKIPNDSPWQVSIENLRAQGDMSFRELMIKLLPSFMFDIINHVHYMIAALCALTVSLRTSGT
jgi:hypothetical protein